MNILTNYSFFFRDDIPLLYKLNSPIIHVLAEISLRKKRDANSSRIQIHVDFKLPSSNDRLSTKWDIRCGIVSSFGQIWSLDMCQSISLSARAIRCSCNRGGFFGVFAAELPRVCIEGITE